jgi:hypothetical protein
VIFKTSRITGEQREQQLLKNKIPTVVQDSKRFKEIQRDSKRFKEIRIDSNIGKKVFPSNT